mmetsp:Transcript_21218/g.30333  ORF Transcript_21218/g.30333 Transcript_21218/m.30333 type:complete len:144 (-) Transcript_21218:1599-2030(-)
MGQQLKADFFGLSSMNDNCKRYFNTLWSCSNDWIKAYRSNITTRGHDTNNYCEISVRLFKEDVMHRVKARSLGQLLTILTVDVDNFYSSSLLDASHSRKKIFCISNPLRHFKRQTIFLNLALLTSMKISIIVHHKKLLILLMK